MGIRFLCPQCGSELEAELRHAGNLARCPDCGEGVQVPADMIAPGALLGDLRLERCLGKGGMGVVYLAEQLSMGRRVAVKILSPTMSSNQLFVQRFFHEALATAKLEHPSIVTIHDAKSANGYHYLAMEYVDGESLAALLKHRKRFSERDALQAGRCVAVALAFAWDRHRMLHRDIKPANIMQSKFGDIKLMDLGLAKSAEDPDLTATGVAMGTPLYMSPEQARGEHPLDCRSDMYSLGATIYHLIAGDPPFPGTSAVEIITRHALEPPPPIRDRAADVSEPCVHLLETLLAKRREQRPDTWQALIADIDRVLNGRVPATPRPGQPSQRQRERRRADAQRLAEQAAQRMAQRDYSARVAKTIQAEKNRRAFFILAVGMFTVAVAVFSLGVHLQMRRRHGQIPVTTGVSAAPVAAQTSPEPSSPTTAEPEPKPEPGPTPDPEPPAPATRPAPATPPEPAVPELPLAAYPPATPARQPLPGPEEPAADTETAKADPEPAKPTERLAEEVFGQTLEQIAGELFRGRYENASLVWGERTRDAALAVAPERLADVRADLAAAQGMADRVLASFAQDRGKTVSVQLRTGKVSLLVESVANGRVYGSTQVEQGKFGQSFTPAELAPKEILSRLGPPEDPTANFLRGLVCLQAQKTKTAKEYFQASQGDLVAACLRLLNEDEARRAFLQMLRSLDLPTTFRSSEALAEQVQKAAEDDAFRLRGEVAANAFLHEYGNTRTASQLQAVFTAFGVNTLPPPTAPVAPPPEP